MTKQYQALITTKSVLFVSDSDWNEITSSKSNVEIDGHTYEVRNIKSSSLYVHSFATGISVKPISEYHKKEIVYSEEDCSKLYNQGYRLGDNISDYETEVTTEQFETYMRHSHSFEYTRYIQDSDYKLYNSDKVSQEDLSNFLLQPEEPLDNPFSDYVLSHGNFMKKNCPYTYYAYDKMYNEYCILHLICGETKHNIWTNDDQTKVYGVQKYHYNSETDTVDKLFILGKPHVEIFRGKNEDDNTIICVESFVKAFTLWNSLKKQHTIITTHSKYIKNNDLRFINETFPGYHLAILCDSDKETSEIVLKTRDKYKYYKEKDKQLKSIFGITGNTKDLDINDSIRLATKMCRNYFSQLDSLEKIKIIR